MDSDLPDTHLTKLFRAFEERLIRLEKLLLPCEHDWSKWKPWVDGDDRRVRYCRKEGCDEQDVCGTDSRPHDSGGKCARCGAQAAVLVLA